MSLINKMLQDLDSRGSAGGEVLQLDVKPVAREERRAPLPLVLGLVGGAVAIAGAGALGWRYLQQPPVRTVKMTPAVVVTVPAAQALRVAQPVSAPVPAEPLEVEPAPASVVEAAVPARTPPADAARDLPFAAEERAKPEPVRAPVVRKPATPPKPVQTAAEIVPKKAAPVQQRVVAAPKPAPALLNQGSAVRRGEDIYRRALASLQDGRVAETISLLEQALDLEPRHDAARQTLIGLLVENGRIDEATRHLRLALGINARQPSLAMLLARLQIERGGSGVETLARTLPYASGNGEYLAFLAGALQRQGRHAEAAEQYQAALRNAAGNGVWWMGLGISLQADKRNAEAVTAFRRAQSAGTLTPELQAFVERKLQQLSR